MRGDDQNSVLGAGGMAHVVERLFSSCEALNSNPNTAKQQQQHTYTQTPLSPSSSASGTKNMMLHF
jgi:hypothetical protein